MIIRYKMTCFHPCYILPWYVTVSIPAFFYPPFCFWQEKTGDMKHFPIFFLFFKLDKSCEDMSERGGVPFFFNRTTNKI